MTPPPSPPPRAGEVWEDAQGRRREVVDVMHGMDVYWRRPGGKVRRHCWISTWREWARKARRVEEERT